MSELAVALAFAFAVVIATIFYAAGFAAGRKLAYREWLEALLDDDPLDFDAMLESILQQIQDDSAA